MLLEQNRIEVNCLELRLGIGLDNLTGEYLGPS